MNMNRQIIDEFSFTRNLSDATTRLYASAIKSYCNFNDMSLDELIMEAEMEEEDGVRWKYRKVKKRLMNYRVYLYRNYVEGTAKKYFQLIKTVYNHFDIELQKLPHISDKNVLKNEPIQFDDLPDRELIEKILNIANMRCRAMIFFMVSSGCARMETSNITIDNYVEATRGYHDEDNIYDVLDVLKNRDDVVPTFKVWRKKTSKFYITFCTPEAVNSINNYLLSYRKKLNGSDRLFHATPRYINFAFASLNNKLGLGRVGSFNRFRPHMLRKFNASSLHNDGLGIEYIDSLQGRVKDSVHRSYFMDSPEKLKELYMEHMGSVCIEWNVKSLSFKSKDYLDLEREVYEKSVALNDVVNRLDEVESFIYKGLSKSDLDEMRKYV